MNIYLAILEDRHIDTDIRPFFTVTEAQRQMKRWMKEYPREEWIEEDVEGWEYCAHSFCDDGPSMRIEAKDLV